MVERSALHRTSALAKQNATGADKGAAISSLASDGRSKAGLPHPTPTTTTTTAATTVEDESTDGRSTAATASAGHSSTGTAHRP